MQCQRFICTGHMVIILKVCKSVFLVTLLIALGSYEVHLGPWIMIQGIKV